MSKVQKYRFMLMIFVLIITSISIDPSRSKSSKNRPFNISNPPDVWLNAPDVNVDQILLVGNNFKARASLSASVASLLSLKAGFDISIDQVNLTITNFKGKVQFALHLDNVAQVITRTMDSIDLNPWLTKIADQVFRADSNLLAVFTENELIVHQSINRVGTIVNQVMGSANEILSSIIVGDYQQNMTFIDVVKTLENGFIIKQYAYPSPSDSTKPGHILINILFDTSSNVLNTYVVNPSSSVPH